MQKIHIFNPVAGKGNDPSFLYENKAGDDEIYITKSVGDAERKTVELCKTGKEYHFIVYGGDGTLNEVANGIIKSGARDSTLLTCVPIGSGNDFVRCIPNDGQIYTVDAIKFNDDYTINALNTGVDSTVVQRAGYYKNYPLVTGSGSYILGVVDTLFHKLVETWNVTMTLEDGTVEEHKNEDFLLALFANGQYYGGGFRSAPTSSFCDGIIDVVLIKKATKLQFIKLVAGYKKGKHIDPETLEVTDKFKDILIYRRCTSVHIDGLKKICSDGEMRQIRSADISIKPGAIRYTSDKEL